LGAFATGCPNGESPEHVAPRATRVLKRLRGLTGNLLLFSSGHFLRVLATQWLRIVAEHPFCWNRQSVSILCYDNRDPRAMLLWNDTSHSLVAVLSIVFFIKLLMFGFCNPRMDEVDSVAGHRDIRDK
jgi:broad specificity phosphatase PhoE